MAKENKATKKVSGIFAEFKKFISRGNVLDMSVGVIMGGAFGAIVTAFTNILLSLATWGVPGGLKGLVTVLPALNDTQRGPVGQAFSSSELVAKTIEFAASQDVTITKDSDTFVQWQTALLGKYTLHGTTFTYNLSAVIDWGSFINAIISFLIIALTLFIILKIVSGYNKKKEEWKAKELEKYYEKHPDERPVPEEPGAPVPTELDVLLEIRDALKAKKE